MKRAIEFAVQSTVALLVTAILLEGLVAWSFLYPGHSPLPHHLVRYLHLRFDRNVIQVMPECAIHDEQLTYTLKPGRCVFASREFSNVYSINSLGVRDDEASLHQPHTVVLGDSLSMGWGVDQDESFPAVFERASGLPTLNAGVSSYGTVRELRMLERVDRSALKNVVIQYNENDVLENQQLIERPPFTILSRDQYEGTVEQQARLLRYFPGKYAFNVMVQLVSALKGGAGSARAAPPVSVDRQAELFVAVVERSPVDLGPFRVVVLSADAAFIQATRAAAARSSVPWVRHLEFLHTGTALAAVKDAYYVLDDHPRASGHHAIGSLLAAFLAKGN